VYSYVHSPLDSTTPPIGRIGVLLQVQLSSKPTPEQETRLNKFLHNLCVQIAASSPQTIYPITDSNKAPSSAVDDDETEPVFVRQEFLFDPPLTVMEAVVKFERENKLKLQLQEFSRWELSEGVERKETNLADDVQALLKERQQKK